MEDSFEMYRSERRSFFCPNKLWKELEKQTEDIMSVSTFVRQAIVEKMIREDLKRKEYFESLL